MQKTLCKKEFKNCEIVKENKELQERIDKAIKYINKKENMNLFTGAFSYGEFIGTLEEILKGEE